MRTQTLDLRYIRKSPLNANELFCGRGLQSLTAVFKSFLDRRTLCLKLSTFSSGEMPASVEI